MTMRPGQAIALAALLLIGCSAIRERLPGRLGEPPHLDEHAFAHKPMRTFRMAAADTVIGSTRRYRIRDGDTLLDVARYFDLGYNEIVDANPGVDPMIPPVGLEVLVPTEWVLPCCTTDGIVVNIPEMRLYYF